MNSDKLYKVQEQDLDRLKEILISERPALQHSDRR